MFRPGSTSSPSAGRATPEVALEPSAAAADALRREPRPDVGIDDWETLFSAVRTKLRQAAVDWPASAPGLLASDPSEQTRESVFDCADALDQLHKTLLTEADHRHQLELDMIGAKLALAQARTELLGTQAEERRARHLARHDSLTLLPNRGCFREQLDQALAKPASRTPTLALMYLDLDGFKLINDLHGHDAGDELLRIVAARLVRAVRADDMVGRLGGDEFGCLLPGMPRREPLSHLAAKLVDAVSAPLKVGELTLVVRASIGIALYPADGNTSETLLKVADAAMYRAKRQQTGYAFADERAPLRSVPQERDQAREA